MAERVSVDPDRLEYVAFRFGVEAEKIRHMNAEIRNRLKLLETSWEGQVEVDFVRKYELAESSLRKVPEALDTIRADLKSIASRFRAADRS